MTAIADRLRVGFLVLGIGYFLAHIALAVTR